MAEFKRKVEPVWIAKRRAAIDVWLGFIATFLNVNEGSMFGTQMPATSGRLHITESIRKTQTEHDDKLHRLGTPSRYFEIANGPEEGNIYVSPGRHYYDHYEENRKSFWRDLFGWSRSFYHLFSCSLKMGTWNKRALRISVIKTFFIRFTMSLNISNYTMPLSSSMMVVPQLRKSYT